MNNNFSIHHCACELNCESSKSVSLLPCSSLLGIVFQYTYTWIQPGAVVAVGHFYSKICGGKYSLICLGEYKR